MVSFIRHVLPMLGDTSNDIHRQGAAEACAVLATRLQLDLLPYLVLLVIPIMGRMSDFDAEVRSMIANTFGVLIKLMPLEAGVADPGLPSDLAQRKSEQRFFLDQLMDPSKLERYRLPVPIKTELRSYQQAGLDWMGFLNKYQLHGILCDDMGLGKTLQVKQ